MSAPPPSAIGEAILARCTRTGPQHRISGSDISLFIESPFSLYCKHFVDRSEMDPPDASQTLFSEHGHMHETRLMAERYSGGPGGGVPQKAPGGVPGGSGNFGPGGASRGGSKGGSRRGSRDGSRQGSRSGSRQGSRRRRWLTPAERAVQLDQERVRGFEDTIRLMGEGVESLLEPQLCFFPRGLHGSPDILERRDGESCLGDYHYIVKEIKSSRKIRRKHLMQTAFYNMMLGEIQGYFPEEFYVLNAAGEDTAYRYADYRNDINRIISGVTGIKGGLMPPVAYGRGIFPWCNYGDKMAAERDDLSLISGMEGGARSALEAAGIDTVAGVLRAGQSGMEKVGIRPETAERYAAQATALKTGAAVRLDPGARIRDTPTKMFLRVEDGMSGEIYMMGVLVRSPDGEEYFPFVSAGRDGEGKMLEEFLGFMADRGGHTIYHWGSGGDTPLSGLLKRHGMEETRIPMKDLHKIATAAVAFPTYRAKLKSVAEWAGFRWTDPDADWGRGVMAYRQYSKDARRQDCLEYVRRYNQDNCLAVAAVRDWLAGTCGVAPPE